MSPASQSGDRVRLPLWRAFGTTAAAMIFVVAGAIGYTFGKRRRAAHLAWAGHVIWSEVAIGVAIGLLAVYFWSRALRAMSAADDRARRE